MLVAVASLCFLMWLWFHCDLNGFPLILLLLIYQWTDNSSKDLRSIRRCWAKEFVWRGLVVVESIEQGTEGVRGEAEEFLDEWDLMKEVFEIGILFDEITESLKWFLVGLLLLLPIVTIRRVFVTERRKMVYFVAPRRLIATYTLLRTPIL